MIIYYIQINFRPKNSKREVSPFTLTKNENVSKTNNTNTIKMQQSNLDSKHKAKKLKANKSQNYYLILSHLKSKSKNCNYLDHNIKNKPCCNSFIDSKDKKRSNSFSFKKILFQNYYSDIFFEKIKKNQPKKKADYNYFDSRNFRKSKTQISSDILTSKTETYFAKNSSKSSLIFKL